MKAIKCDRCGKYFDMRTDREDYERPAGRIVPDCNVCDEFDLCPNCYAKLETWVAYPDKYKEVEESAYPF